MRNKNIALTIVTIGVLLILSSCADTKFTTPDEKLTGLDDETTQNLTTKIETSINDLVTCPAVASKEYKFVDAFKLTEPSVKPVVNENQVLKDSPLIEAKNKTLAYNDVSFTLSTANPFVVSVAEKDKSSKNCDLIAMEILSTGDLEIGDTLVEPTFAIGSPYGLRSAIISELVKEGEINCSALKASPQWFVKKLLLANSADKTRETVTRETVVNEVGIELDVSAGKGVDTVSLNAPPPEAKTDIAKEDKTVMADYIYFLTRDDWVGRIKPSMVEGGCVEYLWDISKNPELKNSEVVKKTLPAGSADEIALQENKLIIKFINPKIDPSLAGTRRGAVKEPKTTATISIDLLSGETKVEKTE